MLRTLPGTTALALALAVGLAPARADTTSVLVVSSCGGQSLTAGHFYPLTMTTNGTLCATTSGSSGGLPVGASNIATGQSAPTNTATLLVAARTGSAGTGRFAVTFYNFGTVTVYVGNSGVTTGTGLQLLPGGTLTLNTTAAVYGVTSTGTGAISDLETY